ncbi:hypothetical protein ACFLUU_04255 [Chloroflexota bacterium]
MDVRSLIEGFLLDCKVTGKSLDTISYYTEKLNKYLCYTDTFGLPTDIEDITATHIREYLAYARTTDKERWGSKVAMLDRERSLKIEYHKKEALLFLIRYLLYF